jgi:uncharacterized protein (TIGR02147 family)
MINIFKYFDYLEYLNDFYSNMKSQVYGFSHRSFLKKAGIASPNYLLRVLKGQRKLSPKFVANFSHALNHSAKEAEYFRLLVFFKNEKRPEQKEKHLRGILTARYSREEFRLHDEKLKFFKSWYYPIIRELVTIVDFGNDYSLLANHVVPKLTAVQARNAVTYLEQNGFIEKDARGRFRHTDSVITTGPEVNSAIMADYHKKTIAQSAQAIDEIPSKDRDISSLTLSVSKETYQEIKKEIQEFRKRLLSLARNDKNPEMVCFAGFQLLPKSRQMVELTTGNKNSGGKS